MIRSDWRTLPPLQRRAAPHPLINPVPEFAAGLTAWQNPSFLAPLAHAVGESEPSGSISDVARPSADRPAPPNPSRVTVSRVGEAAQAIRTGPPAAVTVRDTPPPTPAIRTSPPAAVTVHDTPPPTLDLRAEVSPDPSPHTEVFSSPDAEPLPEAETVRLTPDSVPTDAPRPLAAPDLAPAPTRPRRLGLGEPISSVAQRSSQPTGSASAPSSQPLPPPVTPAAQRATGSTAASRPAPAGQAEAPVPQSADSAAASRPEPGGWAEAPLLGVVARRAADRPPGPGEGAMLPTAAVQRAADSVSPAGVGGQTTAPSARPVVQRVAEPVSPRHFARAVKAPPAVPTTQAAVQRPLTGAWPVQRFPELSNADHPAREPKARTGFSVGPLAVPAVVARAAEDAVEPQAVTTEVVVQRVAEVGPQEVRQVEVQGPQPEGKQVEAPGADELLRKLYDPLLRRLKADLWLDRERRGALTDL